MGKSRGPQCSLWVRTDLSWGVSHFRWLGSRYPTVIGDSFAFLLATSVLNRVAVGGHRAFVSGPYEASLCVPLCLFSLLEFIPEVIDCVE
jgi:hypothetical protein